MMRSFSFMAILALLTFSLMPPATAQANDQPNFVFQEGTLPRLEQSHRFVISGTSIAGICEYKYDIQVPPSWRSYEMRDVGIDPARCIKLMEYGIPTQPPPRGDRAISKDLESTNGKVAGKGGLQAPRFSTISSGYSKAWYENGFQALLTGDTTYLTWEWDGSCVLSGTAQGGWEWNSNLGWSLQSYGGTGDGTCAREYGTTNAYFSGLFGCYHQYSYVKAFGWWDGLLTGDRSATANCGVVYFHYSVTKTTG
jgi:hypothetical protein